VKYVLFVNFDEPGELLLPRAPAELRLHLSRMHEFHRAGSLVMSGAFRTPGQPLATMGVFRSSQAAEAFAAQDPFVLNGMAKSWRIRAWHEPLPEPDWASAAAEASLKYVLSFTTAYTSLEEAYADAPEEIALHVARMQTFRAKGRDIREWNDVLAQRLQPNQKMARVAAPSTSMVWPETKLARAEARKTTTLASSSGSP